MVFQCCVNGCKTVATNGLHSFPSNEIMARKWIAAIKASDLLDKLKANKLSRSYKKVCNKHFRESDFQPSADGKSMLVANSIPSRFLPDDIVVKTNKNVWSF